MTVTDQIKILDRKIKQNESQYDLGREAAKISALSSNNLDKYELLTGENLGLKPSTIEQAKFECSSLGKIFSKGLSEEDKKEGILKGLKNIKGKNEELINTVNTTNRASKDGKFTKSDVLTYNTKYSFSKLRNIGDIKKLSLDSMFNLIKEYHKKCNSLNKLKPQTRDNKNKRLEVIIHAGNIYSKLYDIYRSRYNKKIDSLSVKNKKKLDYKQLKIIGDYRYLSDEEQEEQEEQKEQEKQDKKPFDLEGKIEWMINKEEAHVNEEVFQKYFKLQKPRLMYKVLRRLNDKEKNSNLVNMFNSASKDLKEEIKMMSKEEIENERPDEKVKVVGRILDFNRQNQQGKGLKMLTPNQTLNRLPIALAQLNAGNNSNKLKHEIR